MSSSLKSKSDYCLVQELTFRRCLSSVIAHRNISFATIIDEVVVDELLCHLVGVDLKVLVGVTRYDADRQLSSVDGAPDVRRFRLYRVDAVKSRVATHPDQVCCDCHFTVFVS